MTPVPEVRRLIDQHVHPLAAEPIPLAQLHGRILREPVAAPDDIPLFDRSAMDGYAIRADDAADTFAIVGEVRAGEVVSRQLAAGEAVRIFTGARLPGCDLKVVMQEHVDAEGGRMRIRQRSAASNVRKRGEDARAGEVLLETGATLDATALALLATMGRTSVLASRRPSILHVTTGDEIVPPEAMPSEGQIRNSNASLIAGLCREQGIDEVRHIHVGDDFERMLGVLKEVDIEKIDLVLFSGGSGRGAYDFTGKIFAALDATVHVRQVDVRPGKPLIFGTNSSRVFFGLPGNALSHHVCFHLFVRHALDRLLGRPPADFAGAFLAEPMPDTANDRETWWPVRVKLMRGRVECRALAWKSSGDITRLPEANALLRVPASTPHLTGETMVEVLLTRPL
jgi:molybdopterin molybdotransferase